MLREMLWEKDKARECVRLNETENMPEHRLLFAFCDREAASSTAAGVASRAAVAKQQPASPGQGHRQSAAQLALAAQQLEAFLMEIPVMRCGFLASAFLYIALLFFCRFLALA